jgi:hypothetical protein
VFKAAKLTGNPHPHQFRHAFATKLLSHGTSVENVAALLGNSPKIVWKHYAAWVKERQEARDQAVLTANGSGHLHGNQEEASKGERRTHGRALYKYRTKSSSRLKTSKTFNKTP